MKKRRDVYREEDKWRRERRRQRRQRRHEDTKTRALKIISLHFDLTPLPCYNCYTCYTCRSTTRLFAISFTRTGKSYGLLYILLYRLFAISFTQTGKLVVGVYSFTQYYMTTAVLVLTLVTVEKWERGKWGRGKDISVLRLVWHTSTHTHTHAISQHVLTWYSFPCLPSLPSPHLPRLSRLPFLLFPPSSSSILHPHYTHPCSDGNSSNETNLKIVEGRDRTPSIPGLREKVITS